MARETLNHDQFARSGGGSRRFSDESVSGPGGYFVSRHPEEGGEHQHPSDRLTAVQAAAHWSRHRQRALDTAHDPNEVYQGLWHHDGTGYLDVSDRVQSQKVAIRRGIDNRQEAVWDNNRQGSLFLNSTGLPTAHIATPTDTEHKPAQAHYRLTNKGFL